MLFEGLNKISSAKQNKYNPVVFQFKLSYQTFKASFETFKGLKTRPLHFSEGYTSATTNLAMTLTWRRFFLGSSPPLAQLNFSWVYHLPLAKFFLGLSSPTDLVFPRLKTSPYLRFFLVLSSPPGLVFTEFITSPQLTWFSFFNHFIFLYSRRFVRRRRRRRIVRRRRYEYF